MKQLFRFAAIVVAIASALWACDKKEQPLTPPEGGIIVDVSLPDGSLEPRKLGIVAGGETYTFPLSTQNLNAGRRVSAGVLLSLDGFSDGDLIPVYLIDAGQEVYSADLPVSGNKTLLQGSLVKADFVSGDGTQQSPYLIANTRQLRNMLTLYKNASPSSKTAFKKWFALLEDVSAGKNNWPALNNTGQYFKAIDFDGRGHTISDLSSSGTYASFVGVLYGRIRNVTFDGATINGASSKCGVVAGYLGTTGLPGSCENVAVTNSTVTATAYAGGFAGQVRTTGDIVGCTVKNTTVTSNNYVGGFAGVMDITGDDKYEVPARFKDCHVVDVTVNQNATGSSTLYTGGFIGGSVQAGTYTDCTVKATVNANKGAVQCVGGFVGGTSYAGSNFKGCRVLSGTVVNASGNWAGGFVGRADAADGYTRCESSATVASTVAYTGGFAGYACGSACFTQCKASGSVNGSTQVGGFIGTALNASFNACGVTDASVVGTAGPVGGFVGQVEEGVYIAYSYVVSSTDGQSSVGSFVGSCNAANATVANCIGWHATLPFCGQNPSGATLSNNYSGTAGTVSSQAAQLGWPAASWNLEGSLPVALEGARYVNAIFVGDSITWQWGRNEGEYNKEKYPLKIDFNPAYMIDNGTTVTVKFHPGFFSSHGYLDKGISGQNTTQMRQRFQKDVIDVKPYAVVIMAGTNDLAQGVTKDDIVENIAFMAAAATAADIKVVLCSVTPNNTSYSRLSNPSTKGAHIIALNEKIKNLCTSKGYTWCNYWDALVADDGLALHPDYCLYDLLHPGPDGYDVMEPIIQGILEDLL